MPLPNSSDHDLTESDWPALNSSPGPPKREPTAPSESEKPKSSLHNSSSASTMVDTKEQKPRPQGWAAPKSASNSPDVNSRALDPSEFPSLSGSASDEAAQESSDPVDQIPTPSDQNLADDQGTFDYQAAIEYLDQRFNRIKPEHQAPRSFRGIKNRVPVIPPKDDFVQLVQDAKKEAESAGSRVGGKNAWFSK